MGVEVSAKSTIKEKISALDTAAINKAGDEAAKAEEDKQAGANKCSDEATRMRAAIVHPPRMRPPVETLLIGIGWAVCPILDAIGGLNDAMWGLVSGLLGVSPLKQKGHTISCGVSCGYLRISFLFLHSSKLHSTTNAGISNYGAQKNAASAHHHGDSYKSYLSCSVCISRPS